MLLETIRIVADGLANETYGVNAVLSGVPVEPSDTTPPAIVAIEDETRSDAVAVGRYPQTYPCLVVTLEGDVSLQGEVTSDYRDSEVTVLVRYVQANAETAKARTDCYYTLRAVQNCLRTLFSNTRATERTKNNIQVIECLEMEHVPMFENIDDQMVTSGIRVRMYVRDAAP